jgi:predicted SAM-dependent methyltransferase
LELGKGADVRINVGCGKQTWEGFYCIDAVRHPKASRDPDLIHEFHFDGELLVNPVPLPDGCADEVHNFHFIEHVTRWQSPAIIAEFRRLLKIDGRLIMELPNLEAACRNLLAGMNDQMSMWPIYGDWNHKDEFMLHRHGYTPKTVRVLLEENGFTKVKILAPQTHGARANRDMRVEAIRC